MKKNLLLKLFVLLILLSLEQLTRAQSMVSTYTGNGVSGYVNGDISVARLHSPFGICRDRFGNIFIADQGNNCIRKITLSGMVSTYAGTTTAGYHDGTDTVAQFNQPTGVCADDSGNVYVADFQNYRIRKINTSGMVSTVAGSGVEGLLDSTGINARFDYPRGICIDKNYNIYVGDSWNHRIRKISPSGVVTTYAGGGTVTGVGTVGALTDAADTAARFYTPCGIAVDDSGNIFVADAYNHRIRKINTSGMVTTVIGSGATGTGMGGYVNGPALSARLNTPTEVFVDSLNNLYIGDTFNDRVRKFNYSSDSVISLAGSGTAGFVNGMDSLAKFNYTRGVIAYLNGDVYVADFNNHCIRKITPTVTGINNLNPNKTISIYPNPAQTSVYIESTEKVNEGSLIIYNLKGQELIKQNLNEYKSQTDISNLSCGIYFLKLITSDKVVVQKLIKD